MLAAGFPAGHVPAEPPGRVRGIGELVSGHPDHQAIRPAGILQQHLSQDSARRAPFSGLAWALAAPADSRSQDPAPVAAASALHKRRAPWAWEITGYHAL